jgi:prepilin-type N-terminal cleavage/methylation domain-containing protein
MKMQKQYGFSLIEILVSVMILAISALSLAKLNAISQGAAAAGSERQYANRLAEGVIEELRQYARNRKNPTSVSTITLNSISLTNTSGVYKNDAVVGKTTNYSVKVRTSVTATDWTANNKLIPTQVEVSWVDKNNQSQFIVLKTSIHQTQLAENLAPTIPSCTTARKWNSAGGANCKHKQGSYTIHTVPREGQYIFYCPKAGGCGDVPNPNGTPGTSEWVPVVKSCSNSDGVGGSNPDIVCSLPM